ncbi:unnamed protein product [Rotaria sp. Silwood2]|nr:unnamed protein product [Rotaria sp. Silwood2]
MWIHSARGHLTRENLASILINMKRLSLHMSSFKSKIDQQIDELLNYYESKMGRTMFIIRELIRLLIQDTSGIDPRKDIIQELYRLLENYPTNIGLIIIFQHPYFSLLFQIEKIPRNSIKYVLTHIEGDFIDTRRLEKRYDEFNNFYQELIQQNLKPNMKLDQLITSIKLITRNIKQESNKIEWNAYVRSKVPKLVAYTFALWTLKKAEHSREAEDSDNRNNYLFQPYVAQVISIFRMFGIGYMNMNEELKNNLVDIGSSEGKSIVLGITACILALFGFDVHCACYTQYLSQRNYQTFVPLFDSLGLLSNIHYSTLNKLCENLINDNGDICQLVEQIISTDSNIRIENNQNIKRAKILLIDEVDIFFSENFYSNIYTPTIKLRDPIIKSLIYFIWKERNSNLNLNQLKTTYEYNECYKKYPNWILLFDEIIKDILVDIKHFESHSYIVNQNKIEYIQLDNIVYDYKTLFTYFYEYEKGNITKQSLEENIYIKIKCGNFSYVEIPFEFQYIIGVTSTLKILNNFEREIIQNLYKIRHITFIPSVFVNNLKFSIKDDIWIENENDYFIVIKQEIEKITALEKRAVLVFFESKLKLKEFYNSTVLDSLKQSVIYITEEMSFVEQEILIKRPIVSGQIILLTKTFGRGTDFICYDEMLTENGGIHVIQTFISEDILEEIQIQGRTARQGNHGSYSIILRIRDLEKFHIKNIDIENFKNAKEILSQISDMVRISKTYHTIYEFLYERRNNLLKIKYDINKEYIYYAKEKHYIAKKFLSNLISGNIDFVKDFLFHENKGVEGSYISRTICLIDASSSMYCLLHKCKKTVDIMLERISEILKCFNLTSDLFQIQFVVYRNYNHKEDEILKISPWETKSDNLRVFMNSIEIDKDGGNKAIEIGLCHANQENITQVILIGNTPPNTQKDVYEKRNYYTENYWKHTKFARPTYYQQELEKLRAYKIPVQTFFVEQQVEEVFKEIAQKTGGRYEMFDINSSSSLHMLTDLIAQEILRNVGGSSKGDALVEAYRSKYNRNYT